MTDILIVIPARSGSVRVKDKNIRHLDDSGNSLLSLAATEAYVAQLDLVGFHVHVCVSTDNKEYLRGFSPCPALVERPPELSGSTADIADAVHHAMLEMESRNGARYELVVTLQPAVPMRTGGIIASMVRDTLRFRCNGAITGCRTVPWQWSCRHGSAANKWTPGPYPRSQDMPDLTWQEINSVQIARREVVERRARWDLPLLIHLLPPWAAVDVDDQEDFDRAAKSLPVLLPLLRQDPCDGALIVSELNGLLKIPDVVSCS
jgi:CMP-N-acetylneuraminic acid synthetase